LPLVFIGFTLNIMHRIIMEPTLLNIQNNTTNEFSAGLIMSLMNTTELIVHLSIMIPILFLPYYMLKSSVK
jgi:hypothetical protein